MALSEPCRAAGRTFEHCRFNAFRYVYLLSFFSYPKTDLTDLSYFTATGNVPQRGALRRGRSVLDREEDQHESGLALFKRGATLRRRKSQAGATNFDPPPKPKSRGCLGDIGPGPKNGWFIYCYLLTCFVPPPLLRACGTSRKYLDTNTPQHPH